MLSLIAAAALATTAATQDVPATELSDVFVNVERLDPLVTVNVSGDVPVEVIVRSEPVGIRCGLNRFRYDALEAPRLCWTRRPEADVIVLTAENVAAGWTVEWEGCEVQASPTACAVTVPVMGAQVQVRIHRG